MSWEHATESLTPQCWVTVRKSSELLNLTQECTFSCIITPRLLCQMIFYSGLYSGILNFVETNAHIVPSSLSEIKISEETIFPAIS
jgi:hypothetical protein